VQFSLAFLLSFLITLTHKEYTREEWEKIVLTLNPAKYGKLLSLAMPKRIETDAEMDHFIEMMEPLNRAIEHGTAGPEEIALHSLLATLIKEYDDRAYPLPPVDPLSIIQFLMEQRGLRATDLTPIFGARSITSRVLNGKRELSNAHILKLAEFFHVSPTAFLA
jgi:HTH-type transcriptional regulator/antitoxin HigA